MVWFVFSMVNMEKTILLDTLITMEVDHMVMDQVQEDIPMDILQISTLGMCMEQKTHFNSI